MSAWAALLLVAAPLAASPPQPSSTPPAPTAIALDVQVTGLRNAKGLLLVCVTANPKHFPDCSNDPRAIRHEVKAAGAGRLGLTLPGPGVYALSLHHDENGNERMDMRLFLPREGFGFSNNPGIGMGPPKFKAAQFTATSPMRMTVAMKYML